MFQAVKKIQQGQPVYYINLKEHPIFENNIVTSVIFNKWYCKDYEYVRADTPICSVIIDYFTDKTILAPFSGYIKIKSQPADKLLDDKLLCVIHESRLTYEEDSIVDGDLEILAHSLNSQEEDDFEEGEYSKKSLEAYFKFGFGNYLKNEINIPEQHVHWLNQMDHPNNNFLITNQLLFQAAGLYVTYLHTLEIHYDSKDTDMYSVIEQQLTEMEQNRNRSPYYGSFDPMKEHRKLMTDLFTIAEQTLREFHRHHATIYIIPYLRKINDFFPDTGQQVIAYVNDEYLSKLGALDEETQLFLYERNKVRWKVDYELIKENFNSNPEHYFDQLTKLIALNIDNTSQRLIYYESCALLVDHFPKTSLFHYAIYAKETQEKGFKVKPLLKKVAKKLFSTEEIHSSFQQILDNAFSVKEIWKQKEKIGALLDVKRKKIIFNKEDISSIQKQQTEVVQKLNKILEDNEQPITSNEQPATSNKQPATSLDDLFKAEEHELTDLEFTADHIALFQLFITLKFEVSAEKMNIFATSINRFASGVINEINELAFEALEEELILEEEDGYSIENTYHSVLSQLVNYES